MRVCLLRCMCVSLAAGQRVLLAPPWMLQRRAKVDKQLESSQIFYSSTQYSLSIEGAFAQPAETRRAGPDTGNSSLGPIRIATVFGELGSNTPVGHLYQRGCSLLLIQGQNGVVWGGAIGKSQKKKKRWPGDGRKKNQDLVTRKVLQAVEPCTCSAGGGGNVKIQSTTTHQPQRTARITRYGHNLHP